jgi:negative regulator of sigma E activity
MKPGLVGTVLFFALCAGAIAYGVLSTAQTFRVEALLTQIEAAEDGVPYEGIRDMGGPDGAVRLKVASQGGHKRVEFLGLRGESKPATRRPARVPLFNGIPVFLRPGEGRWRQGKRDYGLVVRNYEVVFSGQETVAGRAADVIELRALHPGRPSYRIAADQVNRFPLWFQVLQGAETVFEARFESISFAPKFDEKTFEEKAPAPNWLKIDRKDVSEEQLKREAASDVWLPATLPAGFQQRGAEIFRVQVDERVREAVKNFLPGGLPKIHVPVVHVNYSDGMALLSVVECPADSELWKFLKRFVPDSAKKTNGDIVARKFADRRGAAYLLELEGTVVLVAGNVSAEEIEKIIPTFERR